MFEDNRRAMAVVAASLAALSLLPVGRGFSLAASSSTQAARQQPADEDLTGRLHSTATAWNAGDLDAFVAPYAGTATYMTPAGPIGKAAMLARYRERYFTGSRPDQQLRFEEVVVRPLGEAHSLMTGRYVLTGGGKPDLTGRFTLVWAKLADGWRIVHDHSS
jgi:beta-aspartyl-peptidase (threonine type)